MGGGETANFLKFATPADKAEDNSRIGNQAPGSLEQRVERVTRAVVARVHHHILVLQAMTSAEAGAPNGIESDRFIVRPGRNNRNAVQRHSSGSEALFHEVVESDYLGRGTQAEA